MCKSIQMQNSFRGVVCHLNEFTVDVQATSFIVRLRSAILISELIECNIYMLLFAGISSVQAVVAINPFQREYFLEV